MQARQMPARFAAVAQQRRGEQEAEPSRVLEWFDRIPGVGGKPRVWSTTVRQWSRRPSSSQSGS